MAFCACASVLTRRIQVLSTLPAAVMMRMPSASIFRCEKRLAEDQLRKDNRIGGRHVGRKLDFEITFSELRQYAVN